MANKIKYGLKNVYFAVATIAADGSATYAEPKAFPGAVSLSLEPQGESNPFFADNIEYWAGISNAGYEGDLEIARIVDDFKTDVLGYKTGGNGLVYEDTNATAKNFALLFQFEGDEHATRHVFYNCTATRPNVSGQTRSDTVEPQTETITISAASIYVSALDTNISKAEVDNVTATAAVYSAFYSAVTLPTATTT